MLFFFVGRFFFVFNFFFNLVIRKNLKFQKRGLIEEKGRLDAPGRPILYVTTDTFLRCFGLTKPTDLPPLDLRSLNLETSQGLQLEIDENGENIAAENEENTEQ